MNHGRSKRKGQSGASGGTQAVPRADENAETLRAEVARCAVRINEHVGRLSAVGSQAFYSTGGLSRDATADELRGLSADLRGVVCHAKVLLAEIQSEVGRLDALAVFRELESPIE